MTVDRDWIDPRTGIAWTIWVEEPPATPSRAEGFFCFRSDDFEPDRSFRTYEILRERRVDFTDAWLRDLLLRALRASGYRELYEELERGEEAG